MREFQRDVARWMAHCFGAVIAADKVERNHRFLEESLELVQSAGCTRNEALQLVDYVFGRPVGELVQEVGGVAVTLAALCDAHGLDLDAAAWAERQRIWASVEKIRSKQAGKPKHSPLPQSVSLPANIWVIELAALVEWHGRCAQASEQSDDFNGAAQHRARAAELNQELARELAR